MPNPNCLSTNPNCETICSFCQAVQAKRAANKSVIKNETQTAKQRVQALGRLKKGVRNKTEQAYEDEVLRPAMLRGEIVWYAFEPWKLRLAELTSLTPDFGVMLADGSIECHEVKGFWQDDARAKTKIAAEMHPFKIIAITREKKEWKREEF